MPAALMPALPSSAELAALPELQRELVRKLHMEAAMVAAPADLGLRGAYFDLLLGFSGSRTGLSHALLPELGQPLYFRCGSTDMFNLTQIFRDDAYGFTLRATPLRILDLGAYCGYAAVYLARRFPQAELVCVEPCPSSFRLLSMNIAPHRRIRAINAAVWHSATRLGVKARYFGDWGTQFEDALPTADRGVAAYPVDDLLAMVGWERADLIKCDIEGSEAAVFADPGARWLRHLDVLAIETHDAIVAESTARVLACFDPGRFACSRHGEAHVFERRVPRRAVVAPPPRAMPLVNSEPGLFPIALQDVAGDAWGFFTFDGESFQLHPNPPGEPPARAIFPRTLDGQTRFSAELHHAGAPSAGVVFTLIVQREDGSEVLRAERMLQAQQRAWFEVGLPALVGRHRFVLQGEMAAGAPHNINAWARWVNPRLA